MKRALWFALAFALLVAGVESLKVLVAWWQAGRPAPGLAELLSFAVFGVAALAWWRHSVFTCRNKACLLPDEDKTDARETR
ncbi:MAG: hypothetical protein HZA64_08385 [Rhodocyclales bacterium]|nr:hypothetical protein [Rhodocyclales bacterium]